MKWYYAAIGCVALAGVCGAARGFPEETTDAQDDPTMIPTSFLGVSFGSFISGTFKTPGTAGDVDYYEASDLVPYAQYVVEVSVADFDVSVYRKEAASPACSADTSKGYVYLDSTQARSVVIRADASGDLDFIVAHADDEDFDGVLDGTSTPVASGNYAVAIRPFKSGFPSPADINGDSLLDNGDIADFGTLFLAGDCSVDFTDDGVVDSNDSSAFVAIFLGTPSDYKPLADGDGDRIPDIYETGGGTFVDLHDTGTEDDDADSDDDKMTDGEELIGTTKALGLPVMGADPNRQTILVEIDWHKGDIDGTSTARDFECPEVVSDRLTELFDVSPTTDNPDGTTGVGLAVDRGAVFPFLRGGKIPGWRYIKVPSHADCKLEFEEFDGVPNKTNWAEATSSELGTIISCDVEVLVPNATYGDYKIRYFEPRRLEYFRYAIATNIYSGIGAAVSEYALRPEAPQIMPFAGDDILMGFAQSAYVGGSTARREFIYLHFVFHELGHCLGLAHGGFEIAPKEKPNYISAMCRRYAKFGNDLDLDGWPDADEDRDGYLCDTDTTPLNLNGDTRTEIQIAWDTINYSHELLDPLDEDDLVEVDGMGAGPIDWDGDTLINLLPISLSINGKRERSTSCGTSTFLDPEDSDIDVLLGFDDWDNLVMIPVLWP